MSKEKLIEDLKGKVEKFSFIVNGLDGNEAFTKLLELFKEEITSLDDSWHLIPESAPDRMREAKITKMSYSHLVNILEYLKDDIKRSTSALEELESETFSNE